MHAIISALDSTKKHLAKAQNNDAATAHALRHTSAWLLIVQETLSQFAQNTFEEIEATRLLLSRGGRPMPALPADFQSDTLLVSLDAHNQELIALQTVLEVMDDDPQAQTLLADIWRLHTANAKRDIVLYG